MNAICHAPDCRSTAVEGKKHCAEHLEIAQKSCAFYQKLKPKIEKIMQEILPGTIEGLLACYAQLNMMFCARLKHMRYSFKTELWDEGHKGQLDLLQCKMGECEEKLSALFAVPEASLNVDAKVDMAVVVEEPVVEEKKPVIEAAQATIRKWRDIRRAEEIETERVLAQFKRLADQERAELQKYRKGLAQIIRSWGIEREEEELIRIAVLIERAVDNIVMNKKRKVDIPEIWAYNFYEHSEENELMVILSFRDNRKIWEDLRQNDLVLPDHIKQLQTLDLWRVTLLFAVTAELWYWYIMPEMKNYTEVEVWVRLLGITEYKFSTLDPGIARQRAREAKEEWRQGSELGSKVQEGRIDRNLAKELRKKDKKELIRALYS